MTGLIYVAIIALWAAVLIPMWLRRHDDDQARRIERHRTAMGALARFRADEDQTVSALAARRRRIVLASLVGVTVVATATWALGLSSGLWVTGALAMTATFAAGIVLAQRLRAREQARMALERSSARREATARRETPARREATGRRETSARREATGRHETPASAMTRAPVPEPGAVPQPRVTPRVSPRATPAPVAQWQDVFDQTA